MLEFGEFRFDSEGRELIGRDGRRRLSPKAAAVLEALIGAGGAVCGREDLLDRIWPSANVGEEVLTHAIAELRRALGDDSRAQTYIATIPKRGYRLCADVRGASAHTVEPRPCPFQLTDYAECLEAEEVAARGGRRNTERAIALFAAVVARSPRLARAHAGLAKALLTAAAFHDGDHEKLRSAETHCAAALELDSECADAVAVQGVLPLFRGDRLTSERCFARALTLAPESAEVHALVGRSCYATGEYQRAGILLDRASALRPQDFRVSFMAGMAKLRAGDAEGARRSFARSLRMADAHLELWADAYDALQVKAKCLWRLGHVGEAMAIADTLANHPDADPHGVGAPEGGALLMRDGDFDPVRQSRRFRTMAEAVSAIARQ